MTVDTSYLTTQVNNIVAQLHSVFDDIGVPGHERESREAEVGCYPCIPGVRLKLMSRGPIFAKER